MSKFDVPIIYQDPHILVLDKPSGLLSQGDHSGEESLVTWAQNTLGRKYVGLVHRLDRETSGLMVLGKRSKSADRLSQALRNGKLVRKYQAWVVDPQRRFNPGQTLKLKHYLAKDTVHNYVKIVPTQTAEAKLALMQAHTIRNLNWKNFPLALVEFELETGRSHQIRVQIGSLGAWILGDQKYGKGEPTFSRLCLHSSFLEFPPPVPGPNLPLGLHRFELPLNVPIF